ncbi:MAG: 50S ribosomal protein L25 [Thermoanaerobaculia bacterium]
MLQQDVTIEVEKRTQTGKNASNRLREADLIPAVLYGGGRDMETWSLQVPRKGLLLLLRKGFHDNAIFQLKLKGTDQLRHVMIRDLTVDPITRSMLHVDFVRILMDKKLKVKSAVEIVGVPNGVKNQGGMLNVVTHELTIECLPADIPHSIQVDVTEMGLHDSFRVSDLKIDEKLKVVDNADRVIAHVAVPRAEEAAAAVEAVPGAGEPEIAVKKGKKEEEGAAGADAKGAKPGAKAPAAKPAGAKK